LAQWEKGCVPAAAILSPLRPANSITLRRSSMSCARTSCGVWQTLVPTSTMDWWSSGFTWPSTNRSSSRICVMYDCSSRVTGSII
jgi:hypothetical protein